MMPWGTPGKTRQHGGGRSLVLLGLGLVLWPPVAGQAQTYSNPLTTPAFPPAGPTANGPADPVIVDFEGRYYVLPTGNGVTYKAMWSDDLVSWSGDFTAFNIPGGSPWKFTGLWAPEVERLNGRFYLYYTAGTANLGGQHIGVAEGVLPTGPYLDRSFSAPLVSDPSIDAECFADGDDLYLYYAKGQFDPFKLSIWVREMLDPLHLDPNSTPVLCIDPQEPWEAAVAEGPTVIKRDGKYYMFYSAWGALSPNYVMAMAVADHPLGPWVKQPTPLNPILERNDAISLWGPGHGDYVIGPDGIGSWYVHHRKINPDDNFQRTLGVDRVVSVGRDQSTELRYTSSGGTTGPTPRPRLPFDASNFEDGVMPPTFAPVAGHWEVMFGKLKSSANAAILIERPLSAVNRGAFLFDWWLKADTPYVQQPLSMTEFSFDVMRNGQPVRAGFQLFPNSGAIRFVEIDQQGATTNLALGQLPPAIDWRAFSRRIRLTRWLDTWTFYLDDVPLLAVDYVADVGWSAWVRTCQMPVVLDGYRQTVAFVDGFENSAASAVHWSTLTGAWSFESPSASDDGHLRQSDDGNTEWKIALGGSLSLCEFDLSADFRLVNQVTGPGNFPKHGLIHNYQDAQNYALVFIDDQFDVVATNAVIGGVVQSWVNSPLPMPDTFGVDDYRHLAVTTDADVGEFVYTLNGVEMLRRSHPALPACGRAGLITELSQVLVDNFRFSGTADTADVDGDGIPVALDNCPNDANTLQDDGDADGVGDACDRCPGTAPGLPVDPLGCRPVPTGDADFDGDVDAADLACFVDCLAGPDQVPAPSKPGWSSAACLGFFDFEGDLDIDLGDYGVLTRPPEACGGA